MKLERVCSHRRAADRVVLSVTVTVFVALCRAFIASVISRVLMSAVIGMWRWPVLRFTAGAAVRVLVSGVSWWAVMPHRLWSVTVFLFSFRV